MAHFYPFKSHGQFYLNFEKFDDIQVSSFGFTSSGPVSSTLGHVDPWTARAHALTQPRPATVQGILALGDCPVDVGGFHAVPSFHLIAQSWAVLHAHTCLEANRSPDPATVQLPDPDPARSHVQQFPLKAGSLLIWNSLLPHGNFPNTGAGPSGPHEAWRRCRYVQYMHMAPAADRYLMPYPLARTDIPMAETDFSPLACRLYGLAPWPSPAAHARWLEYRTAVTAVVGDSSRDGAADDIALHELVLPRDGASGEALRDMYFNLTRVVQQRRFVAMVAEEQAAGRKR